jgi:hypothetical protein
MMNHEELLAELKGDFRVLEIYLKNTQEQLALLHDEVKTLASQEARIVKLETESGFVKKGLLIIFNGILAIAGWLAHQYFK